MAEQADSHETRLPRPDPQTGVEGMILQIWPILLLQQEVAKELAGMEPQQALVYAIATACGALVIALGIVYRQKEKQAEKFTVYMIEAQKAMAIQPHVDRMAMKLDSIASTMNIPGYPSG